MRALSVILLCIIIISTCYGAIPSVPLYNAADPMLRMPAIGLGTFGYFPYGGAPENFNNSAGFETALQWFSIGGRRWDGAHSYNSKQGVADGILNVTKHYTTTPRKDIFITEKTGDSDGDPANSLGYNDTLKQFEELLNMFNTTYFDLLLIHWPSSTNGSGTYSSDPVCNRDDVNYNPTLCRQSTWKAMEKIYNGYKMDNGVYVYARAIGVSNFEKKHLEDIFNLNSLLPAVNQIEFHGFWHEFELVEYCQSYNILINSYAPLGTPDVEANNFHNWTYVLTEHPVAIQIGNKYKKTAAQIWLRWQWQQNIVFNPRSMNITHMKQNMDVFDFNLNQEEMLQLSSLTEPPYPNNKVCPDPNTRQ